MHSNKLHTSRLLTVPCSILGESVQIPSNVNPWMQSVLDADPPDVEPLQMQNPLDADDP